MRRLPAVVGDENDVMAIVRNKALDRRQAKQESNSAAECPSSV